MQTDPPILVEVTEDGHGVYSQRVIAGSHALVADEPAAAGGTGRGPSPYDFLLIGLGTCTSITLRMYAARKQWPLQRISVRLWHRRVHADDCADCESKDVRVDEIGRDLVLEGPLSDSQKQKLLEIAERCPVHRTLTSEIKIRTRLGQTQ